MARPRWTGLLWTVLKKEMVVEWRSKEVLYTSTFFALLLATIFMFGFFEGEKTAWRAGPGILWVAMAFSGTIAFSRSFARERESGCIAGLRLVPNLAGPLFFGKCAANFVMLLVTQCVLVPMVAVVFRIPLDRIAPELAFVLFLGTLGLCVLGTVLGAALVNIRLKELLLPLVLFPLVIPLLIGGVSATSALIDERYAEYADWARLMLAFDAIYIVLSSWLFGAVLESQN